MGNAHTDHPQLSLSQYSKLPITLFTGTVPEPQSLAQECAFLTAVRVMFLLFDSFLIYQIC